MQLLRKVSDIGCKGFIYIFFLVAEGLLIFDNINSENVWPDSFWDESQSPFSGIGIGWWYGSYEVSIFFKEFDEIFDMGPNAFIRVSLLW